jgi:hypothetical protein
MKTFIAACDSGAERESSVASEPAAVAAIAQLAASNGSAIRFNNFMDSPPVIFGHDEASPADLMALRVARRSRESTRE